MLKKKQGLAEHVLEVRVEARGLLQASCGDESVVVPYGKLEPYVNNMSFTTGANVNLFMSATVMVLSFLSFFRDMPMI